MSLLGDLFGVSYKEICVIGNIYIQGGIWLLSALIPVVALIWMIWKRSSVGKILYWIYSMGYGLSCYMFLMIFFNKYSSPLEKAFDTCVKDLQNMAESFNTTYQAINIYIFVITWIVSIAWNLMIAKLILKDKIAWSFLAMVVASIPISLFFYTLFEVAITSIS